MICTYHKFDKVRSRIGYDTILDDVRDGEKWKWRYEPPDPLRLSNGGVSESTCIRIGNKKALVFSDGKIGCLGEQPFWPDRSKSYIQTVRIVG